MRFNVGDDYTTTLRKAGALVVSKYISAYSNGEFKQAVSYLKKVIPAP